TDCSATKQLFEYEGNIHMVRRWAQEMLGYHFTILHRPERMMKDVDGLSRFYDPLLVDYDTHAYTLREQSMSAHPKSYVPTDLSDLNRSYQIPTTPSAPSSHRSTPTITVNCLTFQSLPKRLRTDQPNHQGMEEEASTILTTIAKSHIVQWLSVTPGLPTIPLQLTSQLSPLTFDLAILEQDTKIASMCNILIPGATILRGGFRTWDNHRQQ
ncbi:MAG: hypothetical protein ACREOZ_04430, partial [Gloeomargaritales cyanobacterium]